MSVDVITINLL